MKIKWGKKTYTFVIIPDANNKVMRFRLSTHLLLLLAAVALCAASLAIGAHISALKSAESSKLIAEKLELKTQEYESELEDKERMIEELQSDLLTLSEQTESMKEKFEELKRLEEQLLNITEIKPGEPVDRPVAISSIQRDLSAAAATDGQLGMGGGMIEVSDEHIEALVADTRSALLGMNREIGTLLANFENARERMLETLYLLRVTPSIWPTESDKISSKYGTRRDPFTRKLAFHAGVDISGNTGDPVYATADGTVVSAGYDRSYGYNVIIRHDNGLSTRYAHLRKILVEEKQKVRQGEIIGRLGSTGKSTGPHLHYEIIKNGKTIDPMPYLQSARLEEQ